MAAGMFDRGGDTGEAAFRERMAPWRFSMLEDEVRRSRPDESVALIGRLLKAEPEDATLMHFRAEARRQRAGDGDLDAALADYQAAARTGREPAVTHRSLGELYKTLKQAEAARAAWTTYLDKAPQAPDAALIRQSLEELKS
jgi:regulator of sirC expression with transglutaminase-like and TPR domain